MRFKKIASVLASAAMVFSTAGFAAAANYPQPFISSSGVPDVAIIYGSHSSAQSDLVGVVNIQNSLNGYAVTGSVSGAVPEGGDFVKLERVDKFYLGENAKDVFITDITKEYLPELLADGEYLDNDNDPYKYTQKIQLSKDLELRHFRDNDYSEMPTIGIPLDSNAEVLTYLLEFTTHPDFTNNAMKNTDLPLFGRNYFVLDVDNSSVNPMITLLDSSAATSLDLGEVREVVVSGRTYSVAISALDQNGAILRVNGETTRKLDIGQTYRLADGTYIGIKELIAGNFQGATNYVEFTIGAGKLVLEDEREVELNDERVRGLYSVIELSGASPPALAQVGLRWETFDREFITPTSEIVMPGFETLKFTMAGFYTPAQEEIRVERGSSSNAIAVKAPIKGGSGTTPVTLDLLYMDQSSGEFIGLGESATRQLVTSEDPTITLDRAGSTYRDKFVVSWGTNTAGESYVVRAEVIERQNGNLTTLTNVATNQRICQDVLVNGDCTIGNAVLKITAASTDGVDWSVTLEPSDSTRVGFDKLYTLEGLTIYLPVEEGDGIGAIEFNETDSWSLYMFEEDKTQTLEAGGNITLTLEANTQQTQRRPHVGDVVVASTAGVSSDYPQGDSSDRYESYVISELATKVVFDQTNNNEHRAVITYHGAESYAEVFLTESSATIGEGSSINRPLLDTEISQASGKNLIVVGGSCVNTVAAQLLGRSERFCGTEWTTATGIGADTFLIQTFARTGGKVATLVAGWNFQDTSNAATALTTQTVDTSVGRKYIGTTATSIESVTM